MAKINARGATEVARYISVSRNGTRCIWLLRSDRKVLRRIADGDIKTGYKVIGSVMPNIELTLDTLRSVAEKRGHVGAK